MKSLEERMCSLLKSCEIDCYTIDGNVKMKELGINIDDPNQVIEFDILAIVGDVGIIFEITVEKSGNKKKIDEFMRKYRSFVTAYDNGTLNLGVFDNIPPDAKGKLEKIKEWRFVYVGTSEEMETKQLVRSKFPDSENLAIINSRMLEYLEHLEECLGAFARNDVLSHLKIEPVDPEAPRENLEITAINLENKKISGTISADVLLFQIPASDLLYLAQVPRFGYDDESHQNTKYNYQRLPKKKKLQDIAKMIKKGRGSYSFPNTVTVVLPDTISVSKGKETVKNVVIPCARHSVRIIDGQHRIFGYAKSGLSEDDLKKSKIMTVGLRFSQTSRNNRDEAKIFVEVNREQTKVPRDLMLLLGYPVLGETSPVDLSAHVISRLNLENGGPLQNRLATKAGIVKKSSQSRPIEIVMISNALSQIFKHDEKIRKNKHKANIDYLCNLTSKYFKIVKSNFADDWKDADSMIFSSKYIAAFVKLLVEYRKKQYDMDTIGKKVKALKNNLLKELYLNKGNKSRGVAIFAGNYKSIPHIREDQTTIARFILKHGLI